jgi:glutamate-ammonia-ligase adenylyltransferase
LDVKLASGGLVDLEFLTHVLQLAHGKCLTPSLGTAIAQLAAEGLMPSEMQQAHALLTRTLVAVRLMAPSLQLPSAVTQPVIAHACGAQNWPDLLAQLETVRQSVAREWGSVIAIKGQ